MRSTRHERRAAIVNAREVPSTPITVAQATAIPDAPSPTHVVSNPLPISKGALVGSVIALVALLSIIGLIAWKYRAYKRQMAASSSIVAKKVSIQRTSFGDEKHNIDLENLSNVAIYMEKPKQAVLVSSTTADQHAGWVPQIKPQPLQQVINPAGLKAKSSKFKKGKPAALHPTTIRGLDLTGPPPSYDFANHHMAQNSPSSLIPIPPTPKERYSVPTPPTPPVSKKSHSVISNLTITNLSIHTNNIPPPLPSPARSESFAAINLPAPTDVPTSATTDGTPSSATDFTVPRLMVVACAFTPSLSDELPVKAGDTVRMVEEYRDGWCLVQEVGTVSPARGVVPRLCLQERKRIVPAHKPSNGSVSSLVKR
ncbi:hypothetical protein BDQ12DRAFT_248268 [Crucibulum laeve]|uniref:SH3 domain-containing protein n=1 Tax=Crucibulum laeve TaxID=68775 RepID=A0A5C3LT83_9AGAR|nr:hypothetical protein BDQ12DRAFT_248268 [Crucibulum laeve]